MADSDIAIIGLRADPGQSQIVLQWAIDDPNVEGLSSKRFANVEIIRSASSSMETPTILTNKAFTAYNDTPVSRGQTYYYQARAIDRGGAFGEYSDVVNATEISGDVDLNPGNGHWKLPSGLLFQWGLATTDDTGFVQVNLPITMADTFFANATVGGQAVSLLQLVEVYDFIFGGTFFSFQALQTNSGGDVGLLSSPLQIEWFLIGRT